MDALKEHHSSKLNEIRGFYTWLESETNTRQEAVLKIEQESYAKSLHELSEYVRRRKALLAASGDSATSIPQNVPKYDRGGPVLSTGLIFAHKGEHVLSANNVDTLIDVLKSLPAGSPEVHLVPQIRTDLLEVKAMNVDRMHVRTAMIDRLSIKGADMNYSQRGYVDR